jgi:hypothetical protein
MNRDKKDAVVVEYYGDPTKMIDDHDSEQVYLTEINERRFDNVFEAIRFLQECNSPITTIDQLLPLPKIPKGFKLILPERNIKIKHQANNALDSIYDLDDIDWG